MKRTFKSIFRGVACAALLASLAGINASCSEDKPGDEFMSPVLKADGATNVARTSVTVSGSFTGNLKGIKEHGVKYSTSRDFPQDATTRVTSTKEPSATTTMVLTGLAPNTHYYYAWYANSGASEVRSRAGEFTTSATSKPEFSTLMVDSVGEDYARLICSVTEIGDTYLIEYGVSYKEDNEATKAYTPIAAESLLDESTNTYQVELFNLKPATKYRIRPYAKNSADELGEKGMMEGYGNDSIMTTDNRMSPEVITNEPTNVLSTSVKVSGKVTAAVGSNGVVDEIGFCYSSTNENPTRLDNTVKVTGKDLNKEYVITLENLQESTTYYVRMYAKNTVNGKDRYGYGEVFVITTQGLKTPVVNFGEANIESTATSITLSAVIDNYDETALIEKGFIYSRDNAQLSLADAKKAKTYLAVTDGGKTFRGTISGLEMGVNYYVRAYAVYKSSENELTGYTGYANNIHTQDFQAVFMDSPEITEIGYHGATITGKISEIGNGELAEKGFVYSTETSNPTLNGANCIKQVVTTDEFVWKMTGATSSKYYYIRSYAISKLGGKQEITYSWNSGYSPERIPEATFNGITIETGKLSAKLTCGISTLNEGTLIEKGFIWLEDNGKWNWDFNLDNCTGSTKCEGEDTSFSTEIKDLNPQTGYLVKAYVKKEVDGETVINYSGGDNFWTEGFSFNIQDSKATNNSFTTSMTVETEVESIEEYGIV